MGHIKGTGIMKIAELICHECGTVTHTGLPNFRMGTMPRCDCGGRRQVVRITVSKPHTAEHSERAAATR
jgi:hypothetical protein